MALGNPHLAFGGVGDNLSIPKTSTQANVVRVVNPDSATADGAATIQVFFEAVDASDDASPNAVITRDASGGTAVFDRTGVAADAND